MSAMQSWISPSPPHFDLVAPIKARAYLALRSVLRSTPRQGVGGPRLMRRGAERC